MKYCFLGETLSLNLKRKSWRKGSSQYEHFDLPYVGYRFWKGTTHAQTSMYYNLPSPLPD